MINKTFAMVIASIAVFGSAHALVFSNTAELKITTSVPATTVIEGLNSTQTISVNSPEQLVNGSSPQLTINNVKIFSNEGNSGIRIVTTAQNTYNNKGGYLTLNGNTVSQQSQAIPITCQYHPCNNGPAATILAPGGRTSETSLDQTYTGPSACDSNPGRVTCRLDATGSYTPQGGTYAGDFVFEAQPI